MDKRTLQGEKLLCYGTNRVKAPCQYMKLSTHSWAYLKHFKYHLNFALRGAEEDTHIYLRYPPT